MDTSSTRTIGRIGRSSYIRNLTGAILVGVALTISSGQLFAAETDPGATAAAPSQTVDARGIPSIFGVNVSPVQEHRDAILAQSTEPAPGESTFELPYEQGRPVHVEQGIADCDESIAVEAAITAAREWPDFDSTNVQATENVVSRHCTSFQDIGGPPYVEEACAAIVRAATAEAQGWPNFDPTSIAIQEVSPQLDSGGYYVIVDEEGGAYSPEAVAAGSTEKSATTDSGSSMVICFSCATLR